MSAQAGPGLPDFLIIGAPKAGTTALHAALAQHPQLYLSPVKEPKFFMCDGPPRAQQGPGDAHSVREWIWERDRYEALFASAPAGALKGESTPFYLWDRKAHRRISTLIGCTKALHCDVNVCCPDAAFDISKLIQREHRTIIIGIQIDIKPVCMRWRDTLVGPLEKIVEGN